MRIYDPRAGRFLSVDPMSKSYPYLTPYQFASNSPIAGIDLDGLEFFKKDNTQYTINYKPVVNAPGVLAKANNVAHNAMAFIWNVTIGAAEEGVKSTNNYFAGGYKESSTDIVAGFNQFQTEAYKYHTTTPITQQLKDFGSTATDLRNYELPAQVLIAHKLSAPTTSILQSGEIVNARRQLAANWGVHSEYINFEKQVYSNRLESTDVLYQYRIPGTDAGSYFVKSLDIKPEDIGLLSSDYSEVYKVTVNKRSSPLVSTHNESATYWRNKKVTVNGGGQQIFSPELKSTGTFEKLNTNGSSRY